MQELNKIYGHLRDGALFHSSPLARLRGNTDMNTLRDGKQFHNVNAPISGWSISVNRDGIFNGYYYYSNS
jgi:hypothetical protein